MTVLSTLSHGCTMGACAGMLMVDVGRMVGMNVAEANSLTPITTLVALTGLWQAYQSCRQHLSDQKAA